MVGISITKRGYIMSKTGQEFKTEAVENDQGVSFFDNDTVYIANVIYGKLTLEYRHDTGEIDEKGRPIIKTKRDSAVVDQTSLTAMCSGVAAQLSGVAFTGNDVELIFKTGLETCVK